MNKKYLYWGLAILGLGTTSFFVYKTLKERKEAKKLKESVEELAEEYDVFN
jgi:hypothetical protein